MPATQFLIEKTAETLRIKLRTQMREMGIQVKNGSTASRLRRKLDKVEVQKVIQQGLPNTYEVGSRQYKMYERFINNSNMLEAA